MSKRRIKEVRVQRRNVSAHRVDKLMNLYIDLYPGVHRFNRLLVPWKNFPNDFPKLHLVLISYESTTSFKQYERAKSFLPDIEPELTREDTRLIRLFGQKHYNSSYILTFTQDKDTFDFLNELKKNGFNYNPKHLHLFLIGISFDVARFMFGPDMFVIDSFEFGKSELTSKHKERLKVLIEYINATWKSQPARLFSPVHELILIGFTDLVGSEKSNLKLGQKRAQAVRNFIRPKLKGRSRHFHIREPDSWGEYEPVVETEEAEPRNRAVMVKIVHHESSVNTLEAMEESLLRLHEKHKKRTNSIFYNELKCIVEKIADFAIEDRFILNPVPEELPFSFDSLARLRIILLIEKYSNNSDIEIYKELIRHIKNMKDAINNAYKRVRATGGGPATGEHPNNIRRRYFIYTRKKYGKPRSIIECLDFEVE